VAVGSQKAVFLLQTDPYLPKPVLRALREAESLTRAGWDVSFVSWIKGTDAPPGQDSRAYPVRRLAMPVPPIGTSMNQRRRAYDRATVALRDAVLAEGPDLVIVHDFEVLRAGASVRRRARTRLFYDSHEDYPSIARRNSRVEGWIAARLERQFCRFVDHVFTVSGPIADKFSAWGRPTTVLYNARPSSEIGSADREVSRRALGFSPGDFVIGFAGALERDRGLDVILEALSLLSQPFKALFVGGPDSEVARLRSEAEALRLTGRVRIDPYRPYPQLEPYYAAMDVGAMFLEKRSAAGRIDLQIAGNLPNKVFDYMARGIPLIVPQYTAMRTLVDSIGAGTAVRRVDPPIVSAALVRLQEGRAALAEMGEKGRVAFRTSYAWEHQARKFLRIVSGDEPAERT